MTVMSPPETLHHLQEGNRRFVEGRCSRNVSQGHHGCAEAFQGRAPLAIVLGCSDSRVPLELIFDQEFGDLFLIRVAGSVAAPSQLGSIEFAVQRFDTPLVVVLGHTRCGAVEATLEQALSSSQDCPPNLGVISDLIKPSVDSVLKMRHGANREILLDEAVRANTSATVERLPSASEMLADRQSKGRLAVVGAHYSLQTGTVEFF
ncbi:MAG: carbonic anhydrase [Xanthomonadales bacterium]|nr:carbonic anhydrase [Gammaproteobacteria bacterium]MBT8051147.1 carbonic anhydrase [Gammaproteobacteria bacterium]MBT8056987.1 carbonic anhydrase [Gammaproteobacteria bacterium]NNJ77674.1 carbonic anhydrase [Xanthomonadales bacterium]NNL04877.1 carbonic anhydrase [Xanthomonadales bacterium]